MPSITEYADAAVRREPEFAREKPWIFVVDEAIRGKGTFNAQDRKRLAPRVLAELRKRGINTTRRPPRTG